MEPIGGTEARSTTYQFGDSLHTAIAAPTTGNSFTALLEMPPIQAVELLHSGEVLNRHRISHQVPYGHALTCSPAAFPSSGEPEKKVKSEPAESGSNGDSAQQGSGPSSVDRNEKAAKRKEREKKGKGTSKKSKIDAAEDAEQLPYVHVRARRGQATDSHSLAERARREKINARMKLLQELVPGCNKISGTALVLDEIINHVQGLQRQVEYLSMRLAAVNPRVDFNLESLLAAGNGALVDSNYQNMAMPPTWPEIQMNGDRQQSQQQWHAQPSNQTIWVREEDHRNLITPEGSLLSYDSAHPASLHSSQLKMEL